MTTTTIPRSIEGSIGSRIRVIFGDTGDEWLLIMNNDNGDYKWQSHNWKGIYNKVATQINNCTNKGRDVKEVDFGPTGSWFINGKKADGTGGHSWWNSTGADKEIKEYVREGGQLKVSFGSNVYGHESYALIKGNNGYTLSYNVSDDLEERLKTIHSQRKTINFVRLFHNGEYYVSDANGAEWNMANEYISEELQKSGKVEDIAIARDGCWLIIRGDRFVNSTGVDNELETALDNFYAKQRGWNNARSRSIREARQRQAREEREARERREAEEQQRLARERAEAERIERETREAAEREAAERERLEREAREAAERAEQEALELAAATRVSSLEAKLEERLIEEAQDIQETEENIRSMEANLQKRKRSLQDMLNEMPPERRARIAINSPRNSETTSNERVTNERANVCVVCHEASAAIAIIPCGHVCLCSTCAPVCASSSGTCPLCRGNIQSALTIYLGN